MKLFNLLFIGFLFFSCSKDDLPDFNKIEGTRVLGLVADKPEANPGDTIQITPLISDLNATSGLQDTVQTCIDLGIAFGAPPTCEGNPTKTIIHDHRALTLPGALENWTGATDTFSVITPSDAIIFNQKSEAEKYNGVNFLVEYILYGSSGQVVKSIKRIVVTDLTKTNKNQNPVLSDVFANGISMTTLPLSQKVTLSNDLSASSAEVYSLKDNQGQIKNYTEELTTTWFITDGETKYYRSLLGVSNEYTGPESAPVGRSAYVLALAHDNRGGLVFVKRKLN